MKESWVTARSPCCHTNTFALVPKQILLRPAVSSFISALWDCFKKNYSFVQNKEPRRRIEDIFLRSCEKTMKKNLLFSTQHPKQTHHSATSTFLWTSVRKPDLHFCVRAMQQSGHRLPPLSTLLTCSFQDMQLCMAEGKDCYGCCGQLVFTRQTPRRLTNTFAWEDSLLFGTQTLSPLASGGLIYLCNV